MADSEDDYVWAKLRAERLINSQYKEIREPSRIIMQDSLAKYRNADNSGWELAVAIFTGLVIIGTMIPDAPPSDYVPPQRQGMSIIEQIYYYGGRID